MFSTGSTTPIGLVAFLFAAGDCTVLNTCWFSGEGALFGLASFLFGKTIAGTTSYRVARAGFGGVVTCCGEFIGGSGIVISLVTL